MTIKEVPSKNQFYTMYSSIYIACLDEPKKFKYESKKFVIKITCYMNKIGYNIDITTYKRDDMYQILDLDFSTPPTPQKIFDYIEKSSALRKGSNTYDAFTLTLDKLKTCKPLLEKFLITICGL